MQQKLETLSSSLTGWGGGDEQKLSVRLKKRAKNEDRISPTADPIWTKQSLKALRMTLIGEKLQSLLKAR